MSQQLPLRVLLIGPQSRSAALLSLRLSLSTSHSVLLLPHLSSPRPLHVPVSYSDCPLDLAALLVPASPPSSLPPSPLSGSDSNPPIPSHQPLSLSLPPSDVVVFCCGVEPRTKSTLARHLLPSFPSNEPPPPASSPGAQSAAAAPPKAPAPSFHVVPFDVERFTSMSEELDFLAENLSSIDIDGTSMCDKYGEAKTVAFVLQVATDFVNNDELRFRTSDGESLTTPTTSLTAGDDAARAAPPFAAPASSELSSLTSPSPSELSARVPAPQQSAVAPSAPPSSPAPKVLLIDLGLKVPSVSSDVVRQEQGRFRRARGKSKPKHMDNLNRQYSSKDNGNRNKYVYEANT